MYEINYYLCTHKMKYMNLPQHNIKVQHNTFGVLVNETFMNATQFKIFLSMIQGCIELKNDLTFFNGSDFLVHIPFKHLTDSIILTSTPHYSAADVLISKSKIEAEVTK